MVKMNCGFGVRFYIDLKKKNLYYRMIFNIFKIV